ncbi:PREDICTED: disheveled-associated activator of morphogenesis 1-like [Amphimedon queenslandica]|uniref:FH2 domain-containing protein n=1 Tax=Amphimedon queenslandica TaxID=400682 RepID=A0AAN0K2J7_AMPQE|nr:PREDICTED: disheveled-associated activator of morphogenesis 1-like [Amphimedon queenslandica]|eukprot:XP_019863565.1 PREDICTED: disheveled-associated activator of morphogenesis 1-like [Amphimedon queenslandica]
MGEAQIGEDTIWADIDESDVYKEINVDDLEKTFKQMPRERLGSLSAGRVDKLREKTFINNKRAQNCSILLTRLKMSDTEIRHTVLTMDPTNKLDKDMVEQVTYDVSIMNII